MEILDQYNRPETELKKHLVRIGDLINMEGPMLILFQDTRKGDLYLFDWVDGNDTTNRWLVYNVANDILKKFITKKISYRSLFLSNKNRYLYTDINSNKFKEYEIFEIVSLPDTYVPDKEVFFDKEDAVNLNTIISVLDTEPQYLINDVASKFNKIFNVFGISGSCSVAVSSISIRELTESSDYKDNKLRFPNTIYKLHPQKDDRKSNRVSQQPKLVVQQNRQRK